MSEKDFTEACREQFNRAWEMVRETIADEPKEFAWGGRLGGDWEGMNKEQLPAQADKPAYLDEAQNGMSD